MVCYITETMTHRNQISKSVRFSVLHRDNSTCVYCERSPADGVKIHIDHKVSLNDGGTDDLDNLVTACDECNLGKGPRSVFPPLDLEALRDVCVRTAIQVLEGREWEEHREVDPRKITVDEQEVNEYADWYYKHALLSITATFGESTDPNVMIRLMEYVREYMEGSWWGFEKSTVTDATMILAAFFQADNELEHRIRFFNDVQIALKKYSQLKRPK